MPKVTVDANKIQNLKLSDINAETLNTVLSNTANEANEELELEDSTLNLAALGANYMLGPIDIQMALGNLVLLTEIKSPFVSGELKEGESLDPIDCMKAIYVLANGRDAIIPIMNIKQRIQNMMLLKPMVEKNPELFDKLMDRVQMISDGENIFSQMAVEFYDENFTGENFQDVVDTLAIIITDLMKSSNDLPVVDVKNSKKKVN